MLRSGPRQLLQAMPTVSVKSVINNKLGGCLLRSPGYWEQHGNGPAVETRRGFLLPFLHDNHGLAALAFLLFIDCPLAVSDNCNLKRAALVILIRKSVCVGIAV